MWTRVEPACGQVEAGRESEKLVFFLRRVDIWLILLNKIMAQLPGKNTYFVTLTELLVLSWIPNK